MKKILISSGLLLSVSLPVLALAQKFETTNLDSVLDGITRLLSRLVILLVSLAVVWLIWNVVRYVMSESDDGKEKAKSQMIYGIISLAVIISIWGIVAILRDAFGTKNNSTAPTGEIQNMIPGVKSSPQSNYSPIIPSDGNDPPIQ